MSSGPQSRTADERRGESTQRGNVLGQQLNGILGVHKRHHVQLSCHWGVSRMHADSCSCRWVCEGVRILFSQGEFSAWFVLPFRSAVPVLSQWEGHSKNMGDGNFQKSICVEEKVRYSQARGFDYADEHITHFDAEQVSSAPSSAYSHPNCL